MTSQTAQMTSIFPDIPREVKAVTKDGEFTELWYLGFGSLFQALQENFKNEGIVIPPLNDANMQTIQNLYTAYVGGTYLALTAALPDISGQTVYDTTTQITNQFVIAQDNSTPPNVILAQWVPMAVMLTNPGNPNGAISGVLNWLCYDTTGMNLYVCTVAGNPATWVKI